MPDSVQLPFNGEERPIELEFHFMLRVPCYLLPKLEYAVLRSCRRTHRKIHPGQPPVCVRHHSYQNLMLPPAADTLNRLLEATLDFDTSDVGHIRVVAPDEFFYA